jgi:hypothetical protein
VAGVAELWSRNRLHEPGDCWGQSQNGSPPNSLRGRCRNWSASSLAQSGVRWGSNWQSSRTGRSAHPNTPWAGSRTAKAGTKQRSHSRRMGQALQQVEEWGEVDRGHLSTESGFLLSGNLLPCCRPRYGGGPCLQWPPVVTRTACARFPSKGPPDVDQNEWFPVSLI